MPGTLIPDISSFIRFHELDPRIDNQCIYITQKGSRCRWSSSDNDQAKKLYARLIHYEGRDVENTVLQDYIVSCCCRSGRAQHRDRIVDVRLLPLLIQRWREEIFARVQVQARLRSDSVISSTVKVISSSPLSEFRTHVAEPTAHDSVAYKIQNQLEDRDFECGSLYIFARISSPGHVKIGWTARSVQSRLDDWSRCGYLPNLLFSEGNIPFAQRAETLAHYELIHEWRRERMCKADRCRKQHCEWFEVGIERAIGVVGNWAKLFKAAPPYDAQGPLKPYWSHVLKEMIKGNQNVTGHMLLQRLPSVQPVKRMPLLLPVKSTDPIKSESAELIQATLQTTDRKVEDTMPEGSIPIKKEPSFMPSSHLSQSLPESISLLKKRLITPKRRSKSTSTSRRVAVPGDDSQPDSGTLRSLKIETSLEQPVLQTEPIIKVEEDN